MHSRGREAVRIVNPQGRRFLHGLRAVCAVFCVLVGSAAEAEVEELSFFDDREITDPLVPRVSTNRGPSLDVGLILTTGLGFFSRDAHIRQGGHAMDENGFALQGLEVSVSGSADPYFRFDLAFQAYHLHFEEAALATTALPAGLQIRAGYLMVPFGRQNSQHLHTWNFVNPTLPQTRFLSQEHFSGTGVEMSVLLPLPWYALLYADVITPSRATGFRSSSFGTVEMSRSGRLDGLADFVYAVRLEQSFDVSTDVALLVGASSALGSSPVVPENRAVVYGGDIYVRWRPLSTYRDFALSLTLEGMLRDTQVPGDFVRDFGGYGQLDVQLSRRVVTGMRGDFTGLAPGTEAAQSRFSDRQTRGSLSLTFLPTHFSKLRLQTDMSRQAPDEGRVLAVFLQAEISAGAHAAHAF